MMPHGDLVQRIDQAFVNWINTDPEATNHSKPIIPTWALIGAYDFWVDKLMQVSGCLRLRRKW